MYSMRSKQHKRAQSAQQACEAQGGPGSDHTAPRRRASEIVDDWQCNAEACELAATMLSKPPVANGAAFNPWAAIQSGAEGSAAEGTGKDAAVALWLRIGWNNGDGATS